MIYQPMTTARFIELAKAKHGDLYDYSETVYTASQKPVSFGCTRCGNVVRLSQAATHLRVKNPGGCRTCNRSRTRICGECGIVVSSAEYHSNGKKCKGCHEANALLKRMQTLKKHQKVCPGCSSMFSDRSRSFCSNECKRKHIDKQLTYSCAQCGKSVRKRTVSTARFQFCNKQCQDVFQGGVGYGRSRIVYSWTNRSKVAKKKYKSESSKRRKMQSESFQWWRLCKSETSSVNSSKTDSWDRRCNSAASLMRKRFEPVFRLSGKKIWDWESKISKERIARLSVSNVSTEDLKWNNRMQHASKNAHNRLMLKD